MECKPTCAGCRQAAGRCNLQLSTCKHDPQHGRAKRTTAGDGAAPNRHAASGSSSSLTRIFCSVLSRSRVWLRESSASCTPSGSSSSLPRFLLAIPLRTGAASSVGGRGCAGGAVGGRCRCPPGSASGGALATPCLRLRGDHARRRPAQADSRGRSAGRAALQRSPAALPGRSRSCARQAYLRAKWPATVATVHLAMPPSGTCTAAVRLLRGFLRTPEALI